MVRDEKKTAAMKLFNNFGDENIVEIKSETNWICVERLGDIALYGATLK